MLYHDEKLAPKLAASHPSGFAQKEKRMDAGSLLKSAVNKVTKESK